MDNKRIGRTIAALRSYYGMTQDDLALKVGYKNKAIISKIESGKQDLTLSRIDAFAEVFDVPPGLLLSDGLSEDIIELSQSYKKLTIEERKAVKQIIYLLTANR